MGKLKKINLLHDRFFFPQKKKQNLFYSFSFYCDYFEGEGGFNSISIPPPFLGYAMVSLCINMEQERMASPV